MGNQVKPMPAVSAAVRPTRGGRGAGRLVGATAWRGTATLHVVLLTLQPVLAGWFLSGDYGALETHRALGGVVVFAGLLQLGGAVLYCWPGRGGGWPILAAGVVFALEIVQITAGYSRSFGLHLPLGVALCAAAVAITGWAWLPRRGGAR